MIRNKSLRRFVIATTLLMGLFTQFQTVFACEFKDGKLQLVCCCDKSGELSKDCSKNDHCGDQQGVPNAEMDSCCDISYQTVPSAAAISPIQHSQQVLLLDAPQPPPILASFHIQTSPASTQPVVFPRNTSTRVTGTHTYLLTQRFRI